MTPQQKLYQIELEIALRKLGDPLEVQRLSLQASIDLRRRVLDDPNAVRSSSEFTSDGRAQRNFEGECERLIEAACKRHIASILNSLDVVVHREMASNEKLMSALVEKALADMCEVVIPQIEALSQPGDCFAVWTDVSTKYEAFFDAAVASEATLSIGPFDNITACMAILALVIQARNHHARGDLSQAWLNLLDATFFIGAQRGASVARALQPAVIKKQKAIRSAKRSHVRKSQLKELVVQLYESKRPAGGWKNAIAATDELYPLILKASEERFPATNVQKKATLSQKTVYDLCRRLRMLDGCASEKSAQAPSFTSGR